MPPITAQTIPMNIRNKQEEIAIDMVLIPSPPAADVVDGVPPGVEAAEDTSSPSLFTVTLDDPSPLPVALVFTSKLSVLDMGAPSSSPSTGAGVGAGEEGFIASSIWQPESMLPPD